MTTQNRQKLNAKNKQTYQYSHKGKRRRSSVESYFILKLLNM